MAANVEWMVSGNRQVPWHGLGEVVDGLLNADEMIVRSHLNYAVETWPVAAVSPITGEILKFSDEHRATVRINGDGETTVLSMVGSQYTPVQNKTLFDFAEALTKVGGAKYETAGVLDDGRKVWVLARLEACDIVVMNKDQLNSWLLLSNSHDASMAMTAAIVRVRVVCTNTLTRALNNAANTFTIRHYQSVMEQVEAAKDALGFAVDKSKEFQEMADALARIPFTMPEMQELAVRVYPDHPEKKLASRGAMIARKELELVYELEGARTPEVASTAWAAYNAVAERADWRTSRVEGAARLNSIWYGSRSDVKERCLRELCDMKGLKYDG